MPIRPLDRFPEWPQQSACMRVENCMLLLREIIPPEQYMEVRREVFKWNDGQMRKAVNE